MAGAVYAERFGGPREARTDGQVRRSGVAMIAHEHPDPETCPHDHVDVVPFKRNLADALGAAGRTLVERDFNAERAVERLRELYA